MHLELCGGQASAPGAVLSSGVGGGGRLDRCEYSPASDRSNLHSLARKPLNNSVSQSSGDGGGGFLKQICTPH